MKNDPGVAAPRVLLVEDEMLIALELENELMNAGMEVTGAAVIEDAMRLAKSEKLNAAVLDLNIRGQSAYPVIKVLQQRGVPVLVVSGYANASLPDDIGPHMRMHKPVDSRRVATTVFEMLSHAHRASGALGK